MDSLHVLCFEDTKQKHDNSIETLSLSNQVQILDVDYLSKQCMHGTA